MTTLRQAVTDGFRESGIIAVGSEPDADEFDEGLRRLQSIIKSVFGNEMGEPLKTVNFGVYNLSNSYAISEDQSANIGNIYIPNNSRVIFNTNTANTIFLQPNPRDGVRFGVIDSAGNFGSYNQTVNANGRHIESTGSVVLSTSGVNREWFYRADLGNWMRVTDLTANDNIPLPEEFDDFFVTLLALRLNPRYGAQTSQDSGQVLARMTRQIRARYSQVTEQRSELGIYLLPSNPFAFRGSRLSDKTGFNKGSDY